MSFIYLNPPSVQGQDHFTDHGNNQDLYNKLASGQLSYLNAGSGNASSRSFQGSSLDSRLFNQLMSQSTSCQQQTSSENLQKELQKLTESFQAAQRNLGHHACRSGSGGFEKMSNKELVDQFFAKGKAFMTEDGHYSMKKVEEWAGKKNPRNAEERNLQKLASEFMSANRSEIRDEINHGNSDEHFKNQLFERKNLEHAYDNVSNERPHQHDKDNITEGKKREQLLTQIKDYWSELSAFGRTANDRPGRMKADAIADIAAGKGSASPGLRKLAESIMNMPGMNGRLVDGAGGDNELSRQELATLMNQQGEQSRPGHHHHSHHHSHRRGGNNFI